MKQPEQLICTGKYHHQVTVQPWCRKPPRKCPVATCGKPLEKYDGRKHARS